MSLGLLICIILLSSIRTFAADLTLRYDKPATNSPQGWERESLPIGNGRIGGNFFGGLADDRFAFNDVTLWTGNETVKGSYQVFGNVNISLPGHDSGTSDYLRELDLADGVGRVSYKKDGVTYKREYFASHPAEAIVIHLTADKPGSYTGSVELADGHNAATTATVNVLTSTGGLELPSAARGGRGTRGFGGRGPATQSAAPAPPPMPAGPPTMMYESQLAVINDGGTISSDGGKITFNDCNSITLILAAGTDYIFDYSKGFHGEPPHARIAGQLKDAMGKSYLALLDDHEKDYRSFFDRVQLDLGQSTPERRTMTTDKRLEAYRADGIDPELEAAFFQFGRYLLISCSRDTLPANLQGLWNDRNNPQWQSDYHTNINIEMNYWPAEPTNLTECTDPLFNMVTNLIPAWRKLTAAEAAAGRDFMTADGKPVRGWTVRTEHNPYGNMSYNWNKTGNAWYAQHFWEHYAFTQDKTFLQNVAYPMMKEVCEFWQDYLKILPDGRLVAPNGWSPEHGPHEDGVSYDQEIIWDLFDNTVHAADALGTDKEFRDKIADMRDHLAKPGIGSWGQLLEWMTEKHDPVLDTPKDDHRHASHLFGLYPGHQISLKTPDLLAAATVSLKARGDTGTEWSMAWKIAFWARLLDGDHAHTMLHHQLSAQTSVRAGGTAPNMWEDYPPFQIDGNLGAPAGITEMLLQSQTGEIHLLPALPSAWPTGSVKGLRARGGFAVDIAWKDGKLTSTTIHSIAGAGGVVRYGDKTQNLNLKPGESKTLNGL